MLSLFNRYFLSQTMRELQVNRINIEQLVAIVLILLFIVFPISQAIERGSIHIHLKSDEEGTVVKEENRTIISSGDIRFNKDGQSNTYTIPIKFKQGAEKIVAYANRKSFSFPDQNIVIELFEVDGEMDYLQQCIVESKENCTFYGSSLIADKEYTISFSSSHKHTWNLWVEIE